MDDAVAKTEKADRDIKSCDVPNTTMKDKGGNEAEARIPITAPTEKLKENQVKEQKNQTSAKEHEEPKHQKEQDADIPLKVETKTGVHFPVRLNDGTQLKAVGLRKKNMLGLGIKIYAFGIYADNEKLKALLREKFGKAPTKPTKEMYQVVIDSDVEMRIRLVIVFSGISMSTSRFDESLGAAIKKLSGARNDELAKTIMGEASNDIKLSPGSIIEISRHPSYVLQTKVMGEVVSETQSELLCRAYMYLYLGDDPFDKEAKEKFGNSMLPLF